MFFNNCRNDLNETYPSTEKRSACVGGKLWEAKFSKIKGVILVGDKINKFDKLASL